MNLLIKQSTERLLLMRNRIANRSLSAVAAHQASSLQSVNKPPSLAAYSSITPPTTITRSFATGTRGARGHGWYQNYRASKGGRHLQGEYFEHESLEEQLQWNEAILAMGSTQASMQVKVMPKSSASASNASSDDEKAGEAAAVEPLAVHTLHMRLASTVMPESTRNFINLMTAGNDNDSSFIGYRNSLLHRMERNIGVCGGDVMTNTGRVGRPSLESLTHASSAYDNDNERSNTKKPNFRNLLSLPILHDPLALWHVPGTVSMLVSTVGEVDSRFLMTFCEAPHLNGIHRAIGMMTSESRELLKQLHDSTLTRHGVPMNVQLVVKECKVENEEAQQQTHEKDNMTDNGSETMKRNASASG
ncbi:hypothetical protein MPSEU_000668900 [Mayamaea pseudoterrestris]|nr:hypothetical protein MPSEU_000668900 [Mayamaea pseudoterrestris]